MNRGRSVFAQLLDFIPFSHFPDGHPNSPTFGHFKIPHPDEHVTVQ